MSADPGCTPGRDHRWDYLPGLGWFNEACVQRCDCGLLRVGTPVQGAGFDWEYFRAVPS